MWHVGCIAGTVLSIRDRCDWFAANSGAIPAAVAFVRVSDLDQPVRSRWAVSVTQVYPSAHRTDRSTESLRLQPDEAASSLSVPGSDPQGKPAGCPANPPVSALPANEETARPIPRRSVDVAPVPAGGPAPIARRLPDPSPSQSPFDSLPSSCRYLLFAYLDIRPSIYADNARLNEP